jgi:RNA recognition motif-containing protein
METSNFIKQENLNKVSTVNGDKVLRAKEIDDDMYGVFVGDLTDEVDEKDLHDFFSQVGNVVKCKIIRNPQTGLSKRYGFVHFRSEELRQKAILELNNCLFRGQPIMVRTQHYKESDWPSNMRKW